VVACTGSEFCRFAVVETKLRALSWARQLDERFAGRLAGPTGAGERPDGGVVRMHLSGCSASCAQPQIADIGFRGDTAHVGEEIVEAVDVGLGGSLGEDAAFGDWVVGALPADQVPGALVALVGRYADGRRGDEPLHAWARRQDRGELRGLLEGPPAEAATDGPAAGGRTRREQR
jgi:ferredoxin-nitrite reductase